MSEANEPLENLFGEPVGGAVAPGIDSRFQMIIVAGKRTKQLLQGAEIRVEGDQHRRKGTSIALEEVKRGLVRFGNQAD
ncbi:MAG TPA: DNA-directed RNA polymerase subunit omega [Pyrinomonadaceae bacterium]|nr:DNA-directed RNA polymerase subunit omega [Pyrinomonadaceae bacterium]